jgi:hypothetical protein
MIFSNTWKFEISNDIAHGRLNSLKRTLEVLLIPKLKNDNKKYAQLFLDFLNDGVPRFSIFGLEGNKKLPFVTFSSLAGRDHCEGAGDCLNWCYSFKAWRYPAAFFRQCQNSVLMRTYTGRRAIHETFARIVEDQPDVFDFRLYVDGDFKNQLQVEFWFDLLCQFEDKVRAYGYSKSFRPILNAIYEGAKIPSNYVLNISSGHNVSAEIVDEIKRLPFVRGNFLAVDLGEKIIDDKTRNKALRDAYGKSAFTCPIKCETCTPSGHACGSLKFKNVDIIIATH